MGPSDEGWISLLIIMPCYPEATHTHTHTHTHRQWKRSVWRILRWAVLWINILLSIVLPECCSLVSGNWPASKQWDYNNLRYSWEEWAVPSLRAHTRTHTHMRTPTDTNAASLKMHGRLWSWRGPERQLNFRDSGVRRREMKSDWHAAEVMLFPLISYCATAKGVPATRWAGGQCV